MTAPEGGEARNARDPTGRASQRPPPTPRPTTAGAAGSGYPLVEGKDYGSAPVFTPANLLRQARRQKNLPDAAVPAVCLLDPDGDIVRHLRQTGQGRRHRGWACYHTDMWTFDLHGVEAGVVGMAVGAPFAVLVAEQLAASGAVLVVSITSAGQTSPLPTAGRFVLIERALRDEGTSTHYLPPARWSHLPEHLGARLVGAFDALTHPVLTGASWTTDAPYRETATAIAAAKAEGIACVEMEAAALYAYATARGHAVVCLAHVTNTMATTGNDVNKGHDFDKGNDFDKGHDNGVHDALAVAHAVVSALHPHTAPHTPTSPATPNPSPLPTPTSAVRPPTALHRSSLAVGPRLPTAADPAR